MQFLISQSSIRGCHLMMQRLSRARVNLKAHAISRSLELICDLWILSIAVVLVVVHVQVFRA